MSSGSAGDPMAGRPTGAPPTAAAAAMTEEEEFCCRGDDATSPANGNADNEYPGAAAPPLKVAAGFEAAADAARGRAGEDAPVAEEHAKEGATVAVVGGGGGESLEMSE